MTRKSPEVDSPAAPFASFFAGMELLLPGLPVRFARPPGDPPACLALLDLTLLAERLSAPQADPSLFSLLSEAEQARCAGFAYPKRQREWLGGRLACKFAVQHLAGRSACIPMPSLSVLPAASGAPLLTCSLLPACPLPAVSISHCDRYAVAMAVRADNCGIDLQKTTPQTLRVAERFAAAAEMLLLRQILPGLYEPQRLTLLWTAKEALKKGMLRDQPAIFEGVTLLSLTGSHPFLLRLRYPGDAGRPALIHAVALDDYFLAYTREHRYA